MLVPGWDAATKPKRAVKRYVYWTATAIAIPVLFAAGLPDLQSAIAFTAMACVLMGGWAYFRTPNLKLGGRILAPTRRTANPTRRDRGSVTLDPPAMPNSRPSSAGWQ